MFGIDTWALQSTAGGGAGSSLLADGVPEAPGLFLLGYELVAVVLVGFALVRREAPAA